MDNVYVIIEAIYMICITILLVLDIFAKVKAIKTGITTADSKYTHILILIGLGYVIYDEFAAKTVSDSIFMLFAFLIIDAFSFYKLFIKSEITKLYSYLHIVIISLMLIFFVPISVMSIQNIFGLMPGKNPYLSLYVIPGITLLFLIIADVLVLKKQKSGKILNGWHGIPAYLLFVVIVVSIIPFYHMGGYLDNYFKIQLQDKAFMVPKYCAIIGISIAITYFVSTIRRVINKPITKAMIIINIISYLFIAYNFPITSPFIGLAISRLLPI